MGKKINPNFLRIIRSLNWKTRFYSEKYFFDCIKVYLLIKKVLDNNFNYLISDFYIEYLEKCYILTIYTDKPGVLIGRMGKNVRLLKKKLYSYLLFNIFINIRKILFITPENLSNLLSYKIVNNSYKFFIKKNMLKYVNKRFVRGIKVLITGRINGSDLSKREKYVFGSIPLHSIDTCIKYSSNRIRTKYGILGIKVWICYFK